MIVINPEILSFVPVSEMRRRVLTRQGKALRQGRLREPDKLGVRSRHNAYRTPGITLGLSNAVSIIDDFHHNYGSPFREIEWASFEVSIALRLAPGFYGRTNRKGKIVHFKGMFIDTPIQSNNSTREIEICLGQPDTVSKVINPYHLCNTLFDALLVLRPLALANS